MHYRLVDQRHRALEAAANCPQKTAGLVLLAATARFCAAAPAKGAEQKIRENLCKDSTKDSKARWKNTAQV